MTHPGPAVLICLLAASACSAGIHLRFKDSVVSDEVRSELSEHPLVKKSEKLLQDVASTLLKMSKDEIDATFGQRAKPGSGPYTLPLAQPQSLRLSGTSLAVRDPKKRATTPPLDPTIDYEVEGVGRVQVWYNYDKTPRVAIIFLEVDDELPQDAKDQLRERLRWEGVRLRRLLRLLSAPA